MRASNLKPGDILLHSDTTPSFGARGVRLFTGSRYTHCAVILQDGRILEQGFRRRIHKDIPAYVKATLTSGEILSVARPTFTTVFNSTVITKGNLYGITCIVDALINHALGRAYQLGWLRKNQPEFMDNETYRPTAFFARLGGLDCSALVAKALHLELRPWCSDVRCVEPDDFVNHSDFEFLGLLEL